MDRRRSPGQRAGLTRARVLDGARALLAEGGLEALTMRALAQRLEVSPNALYSHVADKAELVDALLDDVLADVRTPGGDAEDPVESIRTVMASTYEALLAHPDLVPLYLARRGARGPNAQRLGEIVLEQLERAGVTGARAHEALDVLIVYTIGFAAFTTGASLARGDDSAPPPTSFDHGLRWLLTGIASRHEPNSMPRRQSWRR